MPVHHFSHYYNWRCWWMIILVWLGHKLASVVSPSLDGIHCTHLLMAQGLKIGVTIKGRELLLNPQYLTVQRFWRNMLVLSSRPPPPFVHLFFLATNINIKKTKQIPLSPKFQAHPLRLNSNPNLIWGRFWDDSLYSVSGEVCGHNRSTSYWFKI